MYPRDDESVNKARTADKGKYGYYGYEGRNGYVSFPICIDICKLHRQGNTVGQIGVKFNLSIQDTLTILTTWGKYLRPGDNIYDIISNGGSEYHEIQTIKDRKPITQADIYEVLMDLEDFSKQKGDTQNGR